jgi:beta-lactamase class A
LAGLVKSEKGYSTTLGDLVFRAVVDSDSAASDILFARIGGAAGAGAFLARNRIQGVRVDRDERHLQTETVGLRWRPEYVDAALLERAKRAVPQERRAAAFRAYLKDVRDTATPKGMTLFLYRLATGSMLSATSTRHLLRVMRQTVTFPERLKAGVPQGWTLGHKTGTSGDWQGVNGTTNDVGVLTAPDGGIVAVSVFIAESRRSRASAQH